MALIELFSRPRRLPNWALATPSLSQMLAVWKSRRALAALDADALRDIGISETEATAEAQKPVWDVPRTWRD